MDGVRLTVLELLSGKKDGMGLIRLEQDGWMRDRNELGLIRLGLDCDWKHGWNGIRYNGSGWMDGMRLIRLDWMY